MSRTSKSTSSSVHLRAQLDAAIEPPVDRSADTGLRYEPEINRRARTTDARPAAALRAVEGSRGHDGEMNRSERIGFCVYVAMGILCAAVLVAAALSAIAS